MNIKYIEEFNNVLATRKLTIAFAESITAGLLASSIASISGASEILMGGIVTYDQNAKMQFLNVDPKTLKEYSAESKETTEEMVNGLQKLNFGKDKNEKGPDICVAITGVASPPKNDNYKIDKKVGDVFLAIKYKGIVNNFYYRFFGGRNEIREQAVYMTLNRILNVIGHIQQ